MRRTCQVVVVVLLACAALAQSALGFVQVPGSPFGGGRGPFSLAFSPNGSLLAVANRRRYRGMAYSLSVYSVNRKTGQLSQVPSSPVRAGSGPYSVVFSPSGKLLAVANANGRSASVFSVNRRTGMLGQVRGSPLPTAGGPVAFSPAGHLLATVNTFNDSVSVFSVNQGTGASSEVPGSPFQIGVGSSPQALAFSPVRPLLAVANNGEALSTGNVGPSVSVFSIDKATGALTQVQHSPFPTGPGPYSMAFSPGGGLLAVANYYDQTVSVFSVDAMTGVLTQVHHSPFSIAVGGGADALAFSPGGGLLAVANNGLVSHGVAAGLSVFSVNRRTGALTELPQSPFRAGVGAGSVAFSPAGELLAIPNGSHSVAVFSTAVPRRGHRTTRTVAPR